MISVVFQLQRPLTQPFSVSGEAWYVASSFCGVLFGLHFCSLCPRQIASGCQTLVVIFTAGNGVQKIARLVVLGKNRYRLVNSFSGQGALGVGKLKTTETGDSVILGW